MRVVSPNRLVLTDHENKLTGQRTCYRPYNRYVVSDFEHLFLDEHTPMTTWKWSSFNPWERRYGGQDLSGKTVALYRHTAWGDQLMVSAVPYYLKTLYPDCTIHLYCDPDMAPIWKENPYVEGGAIPIPIPFDAIQNEYDYHIFYEGMLENNGEWDQHNCYDDMFGVLGLTNVPNQFKRPYVQVLPQDFKRLTAFSIPKDRKYLVYHLAPANMNRCYPIDQGMQFLKLFLQNFPDWNVVIVGLAAQGPMMDHYRLHKPNMGVVDLVNQTQNFRDLVPIIHGASMVVCPDSSVMHLTAAFPDVPMVSLWGLFAPDDRARYYSNNRSIFYFGVCPHAPCHDHTFELPVDKCEDSEGWHKEQKYCSVLQAVSPTAILEEVCDMLGREVEVEVDIAKDGEIIDLPSDHKPIKFSLVHPSRGRPEQALMCIKRWLGNMSPHNQVEYILSLDEDDGKDYREVITALTGAVDFKVSTRLNISVVDALNNGAKLATGDVLIYLSDDFDCPKNWDMKIGQAVGFTKFYGPEGGPGWEWVLHVNDGHQMETCTISILSRAYYERWGYIYYPEYFSVYVDNDFTEVAQRLGVLIKAPELVFPHNHYLFGGTPNDATYEKENSSEAYATGKALFEKRKEENFGL